MTVVISNNVGNECVLPVDNSTEVINTSTKLVILIGKQWVIQTN